MVRALLYIVALLAALGSMLVAVVTLGIALAVLSSAVAGLAIYVAHPRFSGGRSPCSFLGWQSSRAT